MERLILVTTRPPPLLTRPMKRHVLFVVSCQAWGCPHLHADELPKAHSLLTQASLDSWEFVTAKPANVGSVCKVGANGVISIVGKPVGYLATRQSYGSYSLHFEWRWPQGANGSNGGALIHISSGPAGGTPWPDCFQMQLKMDHAGDLLPMDTAHFTESLSTAAGAPVPLLEKKAASNEAAPGDWNASDIDCQDGKVTVKINGLLQNEVTGCIPAAGRIGFQLEGAPFELRNVRIVPLKDR